MSILVTGAGGFIGRRLVQALPGARAMPHGAIPGLRLTPADVVVHAGRHPAIGTTDWSIEDDPEAVAIERVRAAGARHVMLSTRAVYGPAGDRPLREGDEPRPASPYGRNKLRLEQLALDRLGERATILRLTNVFGFEWPGRTTFMGTMLTSLATSHEIRFDMNPATRRDFLPVDRAAAAIAAIVRRDDAGGIINVAAGFDLPCGRVADALIAGFGRGRLVTTADDVRDAFAVDTTRLHRLTGFWTSAALVVDEFTRHGAELAQALGDPPPSATTTSTV